MASNGARLLSYKEMHEHSDISNNPATSSLTDPITPVTIIVPHNFSDDDLFLLKSEKWVATNDRYVTDWWVERCLHYKSIMDRDFVLSRPLGSRIIEGSNAKA